MKRTKIPILFLFTILIITINAEYRNGITLAFNQKGMTALTHVVTPIAKEMISEMIPMTLDIGFYETFLDGYLKVNVTQIVVDEFHFRDVEMRVMSHTGIEIVLNGVSASVTWYLWYDAVHELLEDTAIGKAKIEDFTMTLNLVLGNDRGRLDVDVDSFIHVVGIELEVADLPEIVLDVIDGLLVTVINTQLPSALDPVINENVKAELVKMWTGFFFIDPQNTTVLDYNLTAPIFIGEDYLNVYFSGDIHPVQETTCEYKYVPHPDIISPKEEFELHVDYWMSNCALNYLHKNGLFSTLINEQFNQVLKLDSRMELYIELSSRPLLDLTGENIQLGAPLNPQFYKSHDKWVSLLADLQVNIEPVLIPGENYTVNVTGSLGNVSLGCDYVNPGVPEVFKNQIKNADWSEYDTKLKEFVNTTFGQSISQSIALPSKINDLVKKIELKNFHIIENENGSGFIIELDIDEIP